jgi:hypothetical protein
MRCSEFRDLLIQDIKSRIDFPDNYSGPRYWIKQRRDDRLEELRKITTYKEMRAFLLLAITRDINGDN